MPIQPITQSNQFNQKPLVSVSKGQQKDNSADPEFKHLHGYNKASTDVKKGVFLTTFAGVGLAMAAVLKYKGHSLNIKNMFKTNPKNWAIFHIKYDKEKPEIEKLVGVLAAGSVGGGLIGGAIFDKKENMKAKYRESIIQLVGNIGTPLACVSLGMNGFKKYVEPKILEKFPKNASKAVKGIPGFIASGICLVTGIFLGNKVGNTINEKAFHVKDNRKIKLSDMSPHIDDLCLALSLVASDVEFITRIIPAALMVSGFSTGIAQEKPERLNPKPIEQLKPDTEATKVAEA